MSAPDVLAQVACELRRECSCVVGGPNHGQCLNCDLSDRIETSRADVADAIAANVAMLAALDEAFGINATHDDERIYDELPSSAVASAYFMARAAIARCKGDAA